MIKERNTKQKEILIEYLKENENRHLTIQEIQEGTNNQIGLTTTYRIINSLIEKGIVVKIPFDNKQGYCYQYSSKKEECHTHYHLICEKCNKLIHIESQKIKDFEKEIKDNNNFIINSNRIVFYGICNECQNRSK